MIEVQGARMILGFKGEYDFLSNFYPCKVLYEGREWNSSEHAYMQAKSLDEDYKGAVWLVPFASKAKKLGRAVELRPDWEEIKVQVMLDVLRAKFSDPYLASLLLNTGTAYLEETNTWGDRFWGVDHGIGENMLGKLLMQVRSELLLKQIEDRNADMKEFMRILAIREVSDSDREFSPVYISSCRVMLSQKLDGILKRFKEYSA